MKKIYKNCHLACQDTMVDILVENGKFAAIQEHIEAGEIENVENRLNLIFSMKRKYGNNIEE